MECTGTVRGGVVVFDPGAAIEDGTAVVVRPAVDARPADPAVEKEPALGQWLLQFAGAVEGLPPDMARNHDHYIHGTPRKPSGAE